MHSGALDFVEDTKEVILTGNQTETCTSFTILNDEEVEDSEDFIVTLDINDGALNVHKGEPFTANVTIIDDDSKYFNMK